MSSFNEAASAEIEELFGRVKQGRFVATQVAVTPYEDPIGPGQINPVGFIAPNSLTQIDLFGSLIRPPVVVTSLPALPNAALYPVGSFAFLTTDAKLYRNTDGSTWSTAVASGDITGHVGIPIAAAAPALPDTTYPAGSYYWNSVTLALNKTTNGTTWGLAVGAADIIANTITAGKIAAATITTTEIAAATITGSNIAATTIAAGNMVANTITAGQIAAGTITATELAALSVTAAKLNILDAAGTTVLTGAGFGGSWLDFLPSGFYNGNFASGTTSNITAATLVGTASTAADYLASASTDIPPWVVSTESGAGTFKRVADTDAVGGFALQWDGSEDATIFQDVPVLPGRPYAIQRSWRYTNSASQFSSTVSYSFRDSTHAIIGASTTGTTAITTSQAAYLQQRMFTTPVAPTNARFLRVGMQIARDSGSPTVWLNSTSSVPGVLGGLIIQDGPIQMQGLAAYDSIFFAYVSGETWSRHAMSVEGAHLWGSGAAQWDAHLYRSAAKTLTLDSDGSGTALTAVILAGATPLQFSTDAFIRRSAAKTLMLDTDGAGTTLTAVDFVGAFQRGFSGTAFPASPATNDRFYRTDLGMWFFWNGTYWLSVDQLVGKYTRPRQADTNPLSVTGGVWDDVIPHPTLSIYMETLFGYFYVITTSSATKYWTFTDGRSGVTLSTVSNTADTWVLETAAVNALFDLSSPMSMTSVKVSTPGNVYATFGYTYRLRST